MRAHLSSEILVTLQYPDREVEDVDLKKIEVNRRQEKRWRMRKETTGQVEKVIKKENILDVVGRKIATWVLGDLVRWLHTPPGPPVAVTACSGDEQEGCGWLSFRWPVYLTHDC